MQDIEKNTNGNTDSIVQFFRDNPAALRTISLAMSAPYNSKSIKMQGLYNAANILASVFGVSVHIDEHIQSIVLYDCNRTYTGGLVGSRNAPNIDCPWCAQIAGTYWTECSQDVIDAMREKLQDDMARASAGVEPRRET